MCVKASDCRGPRLPGGLEPIAAVASTGRLWRGADAMHLSPDRSLSMITARTTRRCMMLRSRTLISPARPSAHSCRRAGDLRRTEGFLSIRRTPTAGARQAR